MKVISIKQPWASLKVFFEKPILDVKGKLNFWNYNLD